MKITSFDPLIISPNTEDVIAVFEALGFERAHTKTNVDERGITAVRLTDPNGFHVDVSETTKLTRDLTSIRMNVSDFQEAYDLLVSRGFKNAQEDHTVIDSSSESAMMISPSGFSITIVKHNKKA